MKTISQILAALPPNDGRRPFWVELSRCIATGEYRRAFGMVLQNQVDVDFEEQIQAVCLEVLLKGGDNSPETRFQELFQVLLRFFMEHYPSGAKRRDILLNLRHINLILKD